MAPAQILQQSPYIEGFKKQIHLLHEKLMLDLFGSLNYCQKKVLSM